MFNLTIEQVVFMGLFGIFSAIIFLRTPFDIVIRLLLALPFLGLGVGFAFFGLFNHLKDLWTFHKSIKKAGYFDKRLEQFLEVEKIENDALYLKDGSLRAIIHVTPINFHMLSKPEQSAIISAYKEFLNSLDFSVQIVMRTVNLSLDDYLKKLELQVLESKDPKLQTQFKAFQEFITKHITEKKVKNRQFYLVVPFSPFQQTNLFKTLTNLQSKPSKNDTRLANLHQLDIRVKLCQQKLKKSNLLTNRLYNNELLALLAAFFDELIEPKNEYLSNWTIGQSKKSA